LTHFLQIDEQPRRKQQVINTLKHLSNHSVQKKKVVIQKRVESGI